MNDLIIWKTIGSETRTNRAQKVASLEVLPTFLAITRTAKFFCTICSRRLSPREMRMSNRQDDHQLFVPKDFFPEYFPQPKPLSSQFQMSPFQFENLPKWISAISQYNLRETNSVAISCRTKDSFGTSHLCGESHISERRSVVSYRPYSWDYRKTDCQITANKEGSGVVNKNSTIKTRAFTTDDKRNGNRKLQIST